MSARTPGTWRVRATAPRVAIETVEGKWIASAARHGWTTLEEAQANARLIAAAPALQAALLELIAALPAGAKSLGLRTAVFNAGIAIQEAE